MTDHIHRHFDREKKSFYSFKVTAQDNAQYDPRTKQTWVDITILDVNDNAPVFVEVPFVKNITGFVAVEATVLTVRAEDKDTGPNSEISYSIVEADRGGDYFKINSGTGDIKVGGPSDVCTYYMLYADYVVLFNSSFYDY